jgi:hypothetical protein
MCTEDHLLFYSTCVITVTMTRDQYLNSNIRVTEAIDRDFTSASERLQAALSWKPRKAFVLQLDSLRAIPCSKSAVRVVGQMKCKIL